MLNERKTAWIGLGKLGLPMAARLAGGGYPVQGYDLDRGRLEQATARGVEHSRDIPGAVAGCGVAFVSVPDDKALRAVALGEGGVLAQMAPGSVLVETSTVSVGASQAVAEAAAEREVAYLRAPVSGNPISAEAGQLSALVSGPMAAFEQVKPLMATFCHQQTWLGDSEQGRYAKLALNLMIAVSAGMMAEALALARRGGIGWHDMLNVMENSAVGSPMIKYKCLPLHERDFSATFSGSQMAKDLDLILDCSRAAAVPVPLAALMRQIYTAMIAAGEGDDDYIATVRHLEHLAALPPIDPASTS